MDTIEKISKGDGRQKRCWAEALYNRWKPLLGKGPLTDGKLYDRLSDEITAIASVDGFRQHANKLEMLKPRGMRYVWATNSIAISDTLLDETIDCTSN